MTESELRLAAPRREAAALVGPDADAQLLRRRHEQQLVTSLLSGDARQVDTAATALRPSTTCRCGRCACGWPRPRRRPETSGARRRWTGCARGWRPSRRCAPSRGPARLRRGRSRARRQRGHGGARDAHRTAGAGRARRGRRGSARGAHVVPPCLGGTACGREVGIRHRELGLAGGRARRHGAPGRRLEDLPEGLRRLLAGDEALVRTLEAYLDHAGDVKQTAAALSLHRGGLYYRLRRIEEVAGGEPPRRRGPPALPPGAATGAVGGSVPGGVSAGPGGGRPGGGGGGGAGEVGRERA